MGESALPGAPVRRFRVASMPPTGQTLSLDGATAHHLATVLRARPGERVVLFDGSGTQAVSELKALSDGSAVLEVVGAHEPARQKEALHLLLALTKGPAMDTAVRMATEAGVTHLHPVLTARSVPRGERTDRWERIAASSAQQCGRADIPAMTQVLTLADALAALPPGLDARIAMPGAPAAAAAIGPAAVLIGPEGGFAPHEVTAALAAGFTPMGLGRWTFRVDTAVAVAVAMTAGLS